MRDRPSASPTWGVAERFVYDAYGSFTVTDPSWTPAGDYLAWNYLHQGGRYDAATGLYSFRNRDYSPTMMRWMQQDPLGYVDSANGYSYCVDNPMLFVDPLGTKIETTCPVDDYLRGFVRDFKRSGNKKYTYSAAEGMKGDTLRAEILIAMMNEKTVFKFDDPCVKNLTAHVDVRVKIVELAKSAKFKLGESSVILPKNSKATPAPALDPDDPVGNFEKLNNPKITLTCLEAVDYIFGAAGVTAKLTRGRFLSIPGDQGNIENKAATDHPNRWSRLLDSENIIFLGDTKWWGLYRDGGLSLTMPAWGAKVASWTNAFNEKAKAKDTMRVVYGDTGLAK